jgi:hypothetical protein
MSNQSQNTSSPMPMLSLDQLLDSLGFDLWKTISATFVIPSFSLIGAILCLLSLWIFFKKKFKDPVFFYYRLLCIVYIIHLLHTIIFGFLFSPRYFPRMNTYFSSIYLIYYSALTNFLFHFQETLQIAILLTRMKIYNSFVNKHFSAKPWVISFSFFLTCLFINVPTSLLAVKVDSMGTFYYNDDTSNSSQQTMDELYYLTASKFSFTIYGQILFALILVFLNLFLSLLVGIILNVVSVSQYRSYVRDRREKDEAYSRVNYDKKSNTEDVEIQVVVVAVVSRPKVLTQKEKNENKSEKNMFQMALSLCSISIVSRFLICFVVVYFLFFNSFSHTLSLSIINFSIYTIVYGGSIFVFYYFNKMFRQEFKKTFFIWKSLSSNKK